MKPKARKSVGSKPRSLDYPVLLRTLARDEGGGVLAEVPDLPGCVSDGETVAEAMENVADAIASWIAAAEDAGRSVPPPSPTERFSGKWQMRVPKSLHRRLVERARTEGVSLNTLAATLLAEGLGSRSPHSRVVMKSR